MKKIVLDFGDFVLAAELFDTAVAARLFEMLPVTVELTTWGRELYGPIGADLGDENPVPAIAPGGIAYTGRGGYLCIFFGQTPAWPVEQVGRIADGDWQRLLAGSAPGTVVVRSAKRRGGAQ